MVERVTGPFRTLLQQVTPGISGFLFPWAASSMLPGKAQTGMGREASPLQTCTWGFGIGAHVPISFSCSLGTSNRFPRGQWRKLSLFQGL